MRRILVGVLFAGVLLAGCAEADSTPTVLYPPSPIPTFPWCVDDETGRVYRNFSDQWPCETPAVVPTLRPSPAPTFTPSPVPFTATPIPFILEPEPSPPPAPAFIPDDPLAALVCAPEYAWDCETALFLVYRESGGDPGAYNATPICVDGSVGEACLASGLVPHHAQGLFGLPLPLHAGLYDGPTDDAGAQVRAAYRLWESSGGWYPWRVPL